MRMRRGKRSPCRLFIEWAHEKLRLYKCRATGAPRHHRTALGASCGRWIYHNRTNRKKQAVWLWQCDCGNTKEIPATQVKHGGTRSCGCKAMEHITDLRKQDITGERFGRLTAVRPTEQRDNNGSVIWELRCDCGNLTYKTVNALKSGRVLSCGCKYRETRSETVKHRRDMVEGTNVSNIVVSKHLRSNNTSGHTGVGLDRRTGKWYAYINFQKKHYNLGLHKDKSAAIRARRAAEARLHDPVILEYWDSLTEKRKKEFQDYLRSTNK